MKFGVRVEMDGREVASWATEHAGWTLGPGAVLRQPCLIALVANTVTDFRATWLLPVEADTPTGAVARAPIAFAACIPGGADLWRDFAGDLQLSVGRQR